MRDGIIRIAEKADLQVVDVPPARVVKVLDNGTGVVVVEQFFQQMGIC